MGVLKIPLSQWEGARVRIVKRDFNPLILTFSAIAEAQDVLNAANAGAVCRPALPTYLHPCRHPEVEGAFLKF